MFKRNDHVEIITEDLERAIAFYTGVLGFTVRQRIPVDAHPLLEIAYLELGGTVLELMRVQDPSTPLDDPWCLGYRMMALEVEDMDEALAYLAQKGVEPHWGPVSLGASKRAEIRDSEGNSIELRQW